MKKVLSVIVVLLLALVLVGCSISNNNEKAYTQEEVDLIVTTLLEEIVEIKYTDSDELDVTFNNGVYTITEYNSQGEVFDVDEYTIQEVIDIILED